MKGSLRFILIILLCGPTLTAVDGQEQAAPAANKTAASRSWPRPIPARIGEGKATDVFAMTLGEVTTALANATFDPSKDEIKLEDGSVIRNYYRDRLNIAHYRPIDKSIFPLPPSGFCTWYYYYQDVNEDEVRRNAAWIAANLKDYGARYVQIDDGWQAETKEGRHGSRDWTGVDKAFPAGMAALAAYIKSLGLTPGIWIAPHGQSNEDVVRAHPGVFLLKPDGSSASESWEGKYLVDPSVPETHRYLHDLFTKLCSWGYEYFKIDGQPVVVQEYRSKAQFFRNAGDPVSLYRATLETIRKAIGPERYLLGCWGTPIEGVGYMDGSRTGGDVVLGWSGFIVAAQATMRNYYQHNIVWYADPDVMLLRPPLSLEQARAWATLQGLTGQALMASDRLMDLSAERVELLKRVYPAADIRPLDLFPSRRLKRIWDLKVDHLGRRYDVVGVFNFEEDRAQQVYLDWKELALPAGGPIHVFDFWAKEYLGAWEAGMVVDVPAAACCVLTLVPATDRIELISTSRHITQGPVDLIAWSRDPAGNSFSGKSRVIRGDPYELRFAFPRGKNYAVKSAVARAASGPLQVTIDNHQGWSTVRIEPARTGEITWQIVFEPADSYRYPTQAPTNLRVERTGLDGLVLRWNAQYYLNAGYQVYLDDRLMGYSGTTAFPLRGLDPRRAYRARVEAVWDDASIGPRHGKAELEFALRSLLPEELNLADLEPLVGTTGGSAMSISMGGRRYEGAIGARPGSDVEYALHGLYEALSALVGVDDAYSGEETVEFVILGDGKELWRSGPVKAAGAPTAVKVGIHGVERLTLRLAAAGGAGAGRRRVPAAWAEAKLLGKTAP